MSDLILECSRLSKLEIKLLVCINKKVITNNLIEHIFSSILETAPGTTAPGSLKKIKDREPLFYLVPVCFDLRKILWYHFSQYPYLSFATPTNNTAWLCLSNDLYLCLLTYFWHVSVFHDKERSRALWGRNAGYTNGLGPADGSWAATEGDGHVDVAWPVEEGWSGAIRSWINRSLMNHNEARISL